MKAGHNRQRPHGKLLRGLLIALTPGAFYLGTAAQMLGLSEPFQAVVQRFGSCLLKAAAQIQRYVPKRVYSGRYVQTVLADHVALESASEYLIYNAIALIFVQLRGGGLRRKR